jgi:hypothetical protein
MMPIKIRIRNRYDTVWPKSSIDVLRMRVTMRSAALFAVMLGLIVAEAPHAQSAHTRFAGVKSIDCRFTTQAFATWKNGVPQIDVKPSSLGLRFESIDTDDGTARVIGMYGPSDIIVRLSERCT